MRRLGQQRARPLLSQPSDHSATDIDRYIDRPHRANSGPPAALRRDHGPKFISQAPQQFHANLGLTAAGTTMMLNRLEKLGYVSRSLDPADRRRVIVVATDLAARRLSELAAPLLGRGGEMLLNDHSPAEIALIAEFLTRTDELQHDHPNRIRALDPYPQG
ncbi:MAG: MarR family transcriptional regulator [Mycobacterium sp.]